MRSLSILLLGTLLLFSCLREEELKQPFVSYLPPEMDDGWSISSPGQEGMNAEALRKIYQDFHEDEGLWQVRSLLVFRGGKLLAESYTKDARDRTTPRAIWSATKQVMGLLTGLALESQLIQDVKDPVSDYLPEVKDFPDKNGIRVEHLLTMRSGIAYSNDGLSGQTDDILRKLPDDITRFILGLPLAATPGEKVNYSDGDPQLLSSLIQQQCGKPTSAWAWEVLFDKLQVQHLEWDHYKDGTTLGGFGILTTPRDLARFGQCVLDSGRWKGQRVVDPQWINRMTTMKVPDVYGYEFGYLWWLDPSRNMLIMSGHGGQYVFLLPDMALMIVMTAEVNTQGDFQFKREKALPWVDRISAAVDDDATITSPAIPQRPASPPRR